MKKTTDKPIKKTTNKPCKMLIQAYNIRKDKKICGTTFILYDQTLYHSTSGWKKLASRDYDNLTRGRERSHPARVKTSFLTACSKIASWPKQIIHSKLMNLILQYWKWGLKRMFFWILLPTQNYLVLVILINLTIFLIINTWTLNNKNKTIPRIRFILIVWPARLKMRFCRGTDKRCFYSRGIRVLKRLFARYDGSACAEVWSVSPLPIYTFHRPTSRYANAKSRDSSIHPSQCMHCTHGSTSFGLIPEVPQTNFNIWI